ncbi:MAG: glycosyltransferase [Bacteroidales bacterium]|nr:glycosyltransferase [Bacteroidales bacterium]
MTNQLKVLVLSSWYPTRVNATLGNFNEKFSEAIALYNQVEVIHVAADSNMREKIEYVLSENNTIKTHQYYFRKKEKENYIDKIIKAFRFFNIYRVAVSNFIKKEGKPNVVHLNILFPVGIIALFIRFRYGIPYVITENWTGYLPATRAKQNIFSLWISRRIALNASALLPVTLDLKKAMLHLGFYNNYFIVPNVTDIQHFNIEQTQNPRDKKIILHVSSLLDAHKNISGILNVVKQLSEIRSDFELHIVGDGDASSHIQKAKELNLLNNYVFFFGTMSTKEIAEKMKNADFFILFSNYENLPCVIVEAFASGLPVVSSTAGGIAEHLTPDKGLLMEPRDEKGLLALCNKMLDTFQTYDKIKLHQYALDNFSYESVGKKFTEIYNLILLKK